MDQFTYVKRGYDPEEVDKYITTLEQVIKSYKDKDNAIKNAIISAQVAADNVVRNAQMHADAYKVQISEQLVEIRATLDRQRMSLQAFQEAYANMVRKCIQELEQSSMADLFTRLEEMETAISDLQGLEAMSGASAAPPAGRQEYLGHDTARDYAREAEKPHDSRSALRDFGQEAPRERDYPRDNMRDNMFEGSRDIRDISRDEPRDTMRSREPINKPIHETLFDTERDPIPPQRGESPYPQENIRDERRDISRGQSRDTQPSPYEPAQNPDRDLRSLARDMGRDAMQPSPYEPMHNLDRDRGQSREAGQPSPQSPYEPMHNPDRDMRGPTRDSGRDQVPPSHYESMHSPARDIMQPPPHESMYNPDRDMRSPDREPIRDNGREAMRDWDMRDTSRDFAPEPPRDQMRDPVRDMRRDRDPRRDAGRDVRETGRDVRRDPGRDMMRPPSRENMRPESRDPARDPARPPYMPEADNYNENDQNLLPPVASLM